MTPMKRLGLAAILALPSPALAATDLELRLQAPTGATTVVVGPGRVVPYQVVGKLTDASSDGLAYFSTKLSFTGGPLAQANNPSSSPMNLFAPPLGFANPAGFRGTPIGGELIGVGGAQNTIRNTLAASPIGPVLLGVAQPPTPVVLVTGNLSAPYQVGSFTLSASQTKANVILPGQSGNPFTKVDKAGAGASTPLVVEVQAILSRPAIVAVHIGQEQYLAIDAGPANAGRTFQCLGSVSGSTPGTPLPGGAVLPLNHDGYYDYTVAHPNSAILSNSLGVLDANGRAVVTFHPNFRFIGLTVKHAFYLPGPTVDFVSEAESVQVVP